MQSTAIHSNSIRGWALAVRWQTKRIRLRNILRTDVKITKRFFKYFPYLLILKHHVFVGLEVAYIHAIPFLLTVRMSRQIVISDVWKHESFLDVRRVFVGIGELVMNAMSFDPIIKTLLNTKKDLNYSIAKHAFSSHLSRHGLAKNQKYLESSRGFEATMCEINVCRDTSADPAKSKH